MSSIFHIYNFSRWQKRFALSLFFTLAVFPFVDNAWSHKVTIFAWIEGDTVYTQSKFSGGKRVMNSQVVVYDMGKNQLLEGQTDDNGEFSFKMPPQASSGLRVVLNSSMGHMAEWIIPPEDIPDQSDYTKTAQSAPAEPETLTASMLPGQLSTSNKTISPTVSSTDTDRDGSCSDIQEMIDRSLDKKLTPMMDMLIESLDPKPTMRDVIGGIGYIMGLVGLTMYFMARKKGD